MPSPSLLTVLFSSCPALGSDFGVGGLARSLSALALLLCHPLLTGGLLITRRTPYTHALLGPLVRNHRNFASWGG